MDLSWVPAAWPVIQVVLDYLLRLAPVGAFIVALSVYRRQQDDKRKEQASLVSITVLSSKRERNEQNAKLTRWTLRVTNHSEVPIYQVTFGIDDLWPAVIDISYEESSERWLDLLEPEASETRTISTVSGHSDNALAVVLFRDAFGQHWYRSSAGALLRWGGIGRAKEIKAHRRNWIKTFRMMPAEGPLTLRSRIQWRFLLGLQDYITRSWPKP